MTRPRDGVAYWIEPLAGDRGQLHCDVMEHGYVRQSYTVGTPAPIASVREALAQWTGERKGAA
jgi:hypothetical protein